LTKALELAPEELRHLIFWQFGHLEEARGNLRHAINWHRKVARLKPDEASSYIYCGLIFKSQGKLKQAEKQYRRALECRDGMLDEAWFNLGGALLTQRRLEEARDCYLKAIGIDPKYTIAKQRLKDVEQAIQLRSKSLVRQ